MPKVSYCSVFVDEQERALHFYRDVLGMRVLPTAMGTAWLRIDRRTTVLLYPKPDHAPAQHTVLNLPVADVASAVADLAGKGVDFLRYDGFPQDEHGVMRGGKGSGDRAVGR